jgi:glucose 1-dehydrogenase
VRLDGKAALVTGGSSGIGKAIALRLGREGADVAVNYHSGGERGREVAAGIERMGRRAVALGADVGVKAEAEGLVHDAREALGRLDILVNNAALQFEEPFTEIDEESYDLVLDVSLKGAFFCAQAAARLMIERGEGGRIVNTSSIHEDVAFLRYSTYTMAKGGLRMFTRSVCQELAPHGITVNNIAPGAIAAGENEELGGGEEAEEVRAVIPAGRLGRPEEVAALAAYLASDEAAYVTGATFFIDGGMTHWNQGV